MSASRPCGNIRLSREVVNNSSITSSVDNGSVASDNFRTIEIHTSRSQVSKDYFGSRLTFFKDCFISPYATFETWSKFKFTTTKNISVFFSLHLNWYIFELFYVIQFDVDLVLYRKLIYNQVAKTWLSRYEQTYYILARIWNTMRTRICNIEGFRLS